jgi:hypothetical protein
MCCVSCAPCLQVAAAGSHDLWLKWIDALIDFEGSLGRHALLGIRWDSNTSQGDLPVGLLRGSTLTVLSENPAWMVSVFGGGGGGESFFWGLNLVCCAVLVFQTSLRTAPHTGQSNTTPACTLYKGCGLLAY